MKRQDKIFNTFKLLSKVVTPLSALTISLASALLVGCSNTPLRTADTSSASGAEQVPNVELLGQLQLPTGARIINERTLILGAGDSWVGRITMEVGKDTNTAYSFFMEQYPKQGWSLVSAVRGANSLIVFTKQDRNATIEIRDGSLAVSATAILTVTPRATGPAAQFGAVPSASVGGGNANVNSVGATPIAPAVQLAPISPSR